MNHLTKCIEAKIQTYFEINEYVIPNMNFVQYYDTYGFYGNKFDTDVLTINMNIIRTDVYLIDDYKKCAQLLTEAIKQLFNYDKSLHSFSVFIYYCIEEDECLKGFLTDVFSYHPTYSLWNAEINSKKELHFTAPK